MAEKLKSLDDIIGQKNIVKWFKSCIERDKLPQVVMLQGPAGIGKTSIAKIVACEMACKNAPAKLSLVKEAVIEQCKSTDCVKLYNMSNLKSQEAVAEVKSDLSVGFSSTGRKVIIMDEAHGMSDEAQDSLLTVFENLVNGVYIIVCSTELDSFRDAFLSRCILRRLTNLNKTDMQTFLRSRIEQNKLRFELPLPMVYQLLATYTGREPRRAVNLLDSFEPGSIVTVNELDTFFNVFEGKQVFRLIQYLYSGSILQGLDFISDMDTTETFKDTLLELLRAAQDGQTPILPSDAVMALRSIVQQESIKPLLGFTIDCTTHGRVNRNMISGYFLKWCNKQSILGSTPEPAYHDKVQMEDLRQMTDMMEHNDVQSNNDNHNNIPTLETLFANGELLTS